MLQQLVMLCSAILLFSIIQVESSDCSTANCHAHATCHQLLAGHECRCDEGYVGDGNTCESIFSKTHALACTEGEMVFTYNKGTFVNLVQIHVLKNGITEHSTKLLSHGESVGTDSSCHTNQNTTTTLAVTLNYAACAGDAIDTVQEAEQIKRIAVVEIAPLYLHAQIRRSFQHNKYRLTCTYDRKRTVTNGFNETSAIPTIEEIDKTGASTFELEMKFYEAAFDAAKTGTLQVALDEPIYVGIKKVNPDTNLKMVVQNCWATDTEKDEGKTFKYSFVNDRCGLDKTYRTILEDENTFRFQINAFRFIQMKTNVWMHCSVHICKSDSNSGACEQGCKGKRKRRAIDDSVHALVVHGRMRRETEEVTLQYTTSPLIRYMEKETCSKKVCPVNSRCIPSFPAFCRCNDGYVMDVYTKQCSNQSIFHVANFRMKLTFNSAYSDPNSMPFLELAHRFEQKMLAYYLTEKKIGISGLKVTAMTPGTVQGPVVFRVDFIRGQLISEDEVMNKINALHQTHPVQVYERVRIIPETYVIPYSMNSASSAVKQQTEEETSKWVIVAAAVGALCVMLMLVLLVIFLRKRKVVVIGKDGDAKKNQAFEMDA